jgi:Actin
MFPGPRVRLSAPGNTAERRFASWIGGSILGSLGAFHQVSFYFPLEKQKKKKKERDSSLFLLLVIWNGGLQVLRCGYQRKSTKNMAQGLWRRDANETPIFLSSLPFSDSASPVFIKKKEKFTLFVFGAIIIPPK